MVMLVLTGTIVYLLATRLTSAEALADALASTDLALASIAVALLFINFTFNASRWTVIVRAMGYPLTVGRALSVILATRPLDVLLPSRGSDFLRFLGVRDIMGGFEASGSVLAQRAIDVQSLCLLGIVGSAIAGEWLWVGVLSAGVTALWCSVALVTTRLDDVLQLGIVDRFADKLRSLLLAFTALASHPRHLGGAILLSLGSWSIALSIVWTLCVATGAPVELMHVVAFWPLAIFVGMLPLSLAGMGTRDAAFIALLGAYAAVDVSDARLVAVTLGYSVVSNLLPSVIGLPFMIRLAGTHASEK
jgi:uncharacterized protein (TIRG00374 family)